MQPKLSFFEQIKNQNNPTSKKPFSFFIKQKPSPLDNIHPLIQDPTKCTISLGLIEQLFAIKGGPAQRLNTIPSFSTEPYQKRIFRFSNKDKFYPQGHVTFNTYLECHYLGKLTKVTYDVYECPSHKHLVFPDGMFLSPGNKHFNHSSTYILPPLLLQEIVGYFQREKETYGVQEINVSKEGRLEIVCMGFSGKHVEMVERVDREMKDFTDPKMRVVGLVLGVKEDFDEDLVGEVVGMVVGEE